MSNPPPSAFRPYIAVADGIARLFHPHVEVVLHCTATGKIVHIANAFSHRRAGDDSLIANDLELIPGQAVCGPYPKTNWNGRRLRSISVAITEQAGEHLGYLCINHDIEALSAAQGALLAALAAPQDAPPPEPLFALDWREDVNRLVAAFLAERGLRQDALRPEESAELVRVLDRHGIFEIRTAPAYVAEVLGVSRATLYARLKSAREAAAEARP